MLARIDLDLEFQLGVRGGLGRKPENQMDRVACLFTTTFTQPGQRLTDCIDGSADRLGLRLYQV
jgi:hypothetical protein